MIVLRRTAFNFVNKKGILPISSRAKSTDNILKSVYSDIKEPHCTVNEFVWQFLPKYHDKTLTVCALTGKSYTYEQTYRMSISLAASLRVKLKLKNDDTVAIMLPNVPEYPSVALGILEAGCIASMVNPAYTAVYSDIKEPHCTVNEFVWQFLPKYHDKTLTVCALTGKSYTYEQTYRMSISLAASLRVKLKLKNDDTVAIMLPNVPEYPSVALGILEAGCIASMVNPAYTADELKRQFQIIECKAIVSSKHFLPNISQALKDLKLNVPIILIDDEGLPEGTINFFEFAGDRSIDAECLKAVKRSPKDIAILPFSSGTTGFAKAVELRHDSMFVLHKMILDPKIVYIQNATDSFQSVIPAVLPFFHIFGFNALMLNLMSAGVKLVTMPVFKADLFLESLVRFKANHLYLVPPMVIFLGKHPAVTSKHLDSVKEIICGAAPVAHSDANAVIDKKKDLIFRQGYGLTETNGGISIGYAGNKNHNSVGHVFGSGEVKIADLNTQEALGPGKEGEIWYRGPNVMSGYYKNEAATKEVITEDGWFKTGDIGKYDEDKHLYVTDRLKELIKVKGFQVPPAELEMVLRTHPKVVDCAVLGIPDSISGEVPKAFVVVQAGQTLKPEEVLEHVNDKVVSYKKIKEVQFVKAIPKSPAGKILRKQLKETN